MTVFINYFVSLLKSLIALVILQFMFGGNSEMAPPDSIPNSAVKRLSADDSVEFLHVKVGHRQTPYFCSQKVQ